MKKQLIALGLASILTVPSVVLAEATWYGSFRGIVHSQGGETSMMSNGSRWGVKGSSEVSEGLTAVYRYEENLNLANATLGAGNRLSSVGLSGGFGTVTLGQIWSASYNHVGVLTDNGVWSGNQSQTGRTGSALSYSASSGPVSFQIDANMNGNTGRSVDMAQLGMSFDTGAAKVGLAFITAESAKDSTRQSSIGVSVPVGGLTLYSSWSEKEVTTFATMGSPAVVIPGSDPVTIPGSDPVTIPGSDPVTIPGSDPVTIPGTEAVMIPRREAVTIPRREAVTIPRREAVTIPRREAVTIPGTERVDARAGTPDRCLVVRYRNASFGTSQATDDQDRLLYWTSPPPVDPDVSRPSTDTSSPAPTAWRVMVEDMTIVERDPDLEGDDILQTVFREPNRVWNKDTGIYDYSCGANSEGTQVVDGETDRVPFIAERTFQPAVPAVDAVAAVPPVTVGEREAVTIEAREAVTIEAREAVTIEAREAVTIEARTGQTVPGSEPVTVPGSEPVTVPGSEPVTVPGMDAYELMAAVPATPETTVKTRHMHAGVSGSLGDTGMSFAINVANHPDSSDGENPWNFNVSKSLGGGASLAFEYIDNDSMETSNEALVQLRVDF